MPLPPRNITTHQKSLVTNATARYYRACGHACVYKWWCRQWKSRPHSCIATTVQNLANRILWINHHATCNTMLRNCAVRLNISFQHPGILCTECWKIPTILANSAAAELVPLGGFWKVSYWSHRGPRVAAAIQRKGGTVSWNRDWPWVLYKEAMLMYTVHVAAHFSFCISATFVQYHTEQWNSERSAHSVTGTTFMLKGLHLGDTKFTSWSGQ